MAQTTKIGWRAIASAPGSAKLTEADVREIRRLHGTMSLRALGARYGVSHTAIRRAATGAKWVHI